MFAGRHINRTEDRAVLHTALRLPRDERARASTAQDVGADVHEVLDRMAAFALKVRDGEWTGSTGKRIRNVVNIGIGGTDLGPAMATQALVHYSDRSMRFRFVSNIDGTDIRDATADLDPAETLFIVASKTFTTLETLTNARTARDWLLAGLGADEAAVAKPLRRRVHQRRARSRRSASTPPTCSGSGTGWAAGTRWTRRSGCALMIAIGPDDFREMLAGFRAMDEHFLTHAARPEPARC